MVDTQDDAGTFFYVLQDALRILYVDDDPILREFAQVHLTTDTASVATAEDGLVALAMLEEVKPDLILLDLEMPRLDGFEVLRHLRAEAAYSRMPVIVATGREDVNAVDRAFREGATSFVVKPINWRLLSYQIRYVHRAHQAELSLLEARRRARTEVNEANDTLTRLCSLGARFVADALRIDPSLKAPAAGYLQALENASATARRSAEG
ncbi:MAG TPA: response regulator [Phenylobacterium sp.]